MISAVELAAYILFAVTPIASAIALLLLSRKEPAVTAGTKREMHTYTLKCCLFVTQTRTYRVKMRKQAKFRLLF